MKKILALLMAMVMLVSAAGCQSKGSGKEMSAEEVYKSAMEKTNALQDTDMTMNMDMNMAVGGEELTISSDIALKAAGLTTEEMQMNMSMGMELMGQAVDMNMYYKDGYFYTEMAGQKAKQASDVEAAVDQVEDSTAMGGIGAEAMKELEMEAKDNGEYEISFVADGSKLTDYVDSVMGQLSDVLGPDADANMTVGDVTGTALVNKDGYIAQESMTMVMTMTVEGQEITLTLNMDAVYNNPGQAVTVEFPDLSDFVEA